jgi:hypothetical protein
VANVFFFEVGDGPELPRLPGRSKGHGGKGLCEGIVLITGAPSLQRSNRRGNGPSSDSRCSICSHHYGRRLLESRAERPGNAGDGPSWTRRKMHVPDLHSPIAGPTTFHKRDGHRPRRPDGEITDRPFQAGRSEQRDPVTGLDARGDQAGGDRPGRRTPGPSLAARRRRTGQRTWPGQGRERPTRRRPGRRSRSWLTVQPLRCLDAGPPPCWT